MSRDGIRKDSGRSLRTEVGPRPTLGEHLVNLAQIRVARVAAIVAATALALPVAGIAEAAVRPQTAKPGVATASVARPVAKVVTTRKPAPRPAPRTTTARPAAPRPAARPAAPKPAPKPAAVAPVTAPTGADLSTGRAAPQLVTPPAAPALPTLTDVTVPASLATDCSADVSGALNTWLDGLPASGIRVLFPTGACFRTERDISITGRTGWVVDGRGTELRRTEATPAELRYPRNNRHFSIVGSSDVVVRGLSVTGLNAQSDPRGSAGFGSYVVELEFEHAYTVRNSRRVLLEDVRADAVFGDGIYLHSDSSDVTVRGGRLARNGRQGVAILSDRVLVDGLTVASSRRSGFDLEPDTAAGAISDVEIRNSTISSHLLAFAAGGAGDVDRVHLHHNTVLRSGTPFVYAKREGFTRDDWTVTDNWVKAELGSPSPAFRFLSAARAVVARNAVPVATTQSRSIFDLAAGSDVTASCNSFRNAMDSLGTVDASSRLTASDNTTGYSPPACFDRTTVGAPEAPRPVVPLDSFAGAVPVAPLAPGAQSPATAADPAGLTAEEYEQGTSNDHGRSAWLRYTTGPTAETIDVVTTGGLRSIKVVTGPDLWWQAPVSDAYSASNLTVRLQPATTYHVRVSSTTYSGPTGPGTVVLRRGLGGADDLESPTLVAPLAAGSSSPVLQLDNSRATGFHQEAGCQANCHNRSLWLRYTAPSDQRLTVRTTGAFNSLTLISGLGTPQETAVAGTYSERIIGAAVQGGATYWLRLDSAPYGGGAPGAGTVQLSAT